jgi:hypothetical protein
VQNLPAGLTPCFVAFALWKDGQLFYVSSAKGWSMSDAPISDEDLPPPGDPRLAMPVWTLLPNWKNGITERLAFLTDVLESETGAEQRRAVRRFPRRSFEAEFLRQTAWRSRLDMFFAGVGRYEFLVPLWHEQVKMLKGITVDATGVSFSSNSASQREFRTGDLVFVNNGDPDDYELLEVAEVEPERFGWASPPKRRWPAGTRIFPLREARILDAPKLTNLNDQVATAQVRFELSKPDSRPGDWGNLSGGEPVFAFNPNRRTPISFDHSRLTYTLDNSVGQVRVTDPGDYASVTMHLGMTLFGRAQTHAFRQFIAAARGRARRFFCGTFMADMTPVAEIDGTTPTLEIEPIGFTDYMSRPQPVRLGIAVQFKDDTPALYRNITAAEAIHAKVATEYVVRVNGLDVEEPGNMGLFSASNWPLAQANRSWNLAVFDENARLLSHESFDVFADEVAAIALTNRLNGLRPDVTVLVYTHNDPQTGLTDELKAALLRCGAAQATLDDIKLHSAYLLVGIPGIGSGAGIERYAGDKDNDPKAKFDYLLRFMNGAPVGIAEKPTKPQSELLYLDQALPPIDRRNIARISFMSEVRFDQDTFELHHHTNGARAVETSLVIRQFFNTRKELATA